MRLTIATWNVNGLRSAYRKGLRSYIERHKPHVLCLQEIRVDPDQLDDAMHPPPDYYEYYAPSRVRKGYSGVAVYSRVKLDAVFEGIGSEQFDREGRLLRVDFGLLSVVSVYCPKGYSPDDSRNDSTKVERLQYKLAFYDELGRYVRRLHRSERHVVLSGDFNTAHREIDLARPKENERTSGFLPEERVAFDRLLATGLVDAFRVFVHEGGHYTWWSQRRGARERNIGWRIDYHLVSKSLVPFLQNAYIQPDVGGSDHCPVVIELDARAMTST